MQTNIKSGELAKSVLEAEEQLEIHHERKVCRRPGIGGEAV